MAEFNRAPLQESENALHKVGFRLCGRTAHTRHYRLIKDGKSVSVYLYLSMAGHYCVKTLRGDYGAPVVWLSPDTGRDIAGDEFGPEALVRFVVDNNLFD